MLSDYVNLNSKTFDIEESETLISVDKQLVKIISVLNKKGYYTEMCSRAKISTPFLIGNLIHDLIEQELLEINCETKDKIKNVIKQCDYESTLIVFKEEYEFNNLPNGFQLVGKLLTYHLSILEDSEDIKTKSLLELDKEHNSSLKILEEWATKLPNIKQN